MKKGIFWVAFVIVLTVIGMPVLNGMILEKRVRQSFEDMNPGTGPSGSGARFEILSYDRRFFSSEIQWRIVSQALENSWGIHEILFLDRVRHGFTGASTTTSLEKNPWILDMVNKKLNGKNPLTLETEIRFWGRMESRLALEAFSYRDMEGVVEVRPGRAGLSMDRGKDRVVLKMDFEGLDLAGKIRLDGFSWQSDLERVSGTIRAGKSSFFLKKFQSSDPEKTTTLSNAAFDYELVYHPEEVSVSISTQGRLDAFQSGGEEIKNAAAGFHIRHMDAGGYEDLLAFFREGAAEIMNSGPSNRQDMDAVRRAMEKQAADKGFEWVGICEKLLKKGLEIEISGLKAQVPEGKIEADARIGLENDLPLSGVLSFLMDPSTLLAYLSLESRIILPKGLYPTGRMLLSPMFSGMPTGLFVMEKDHLLHRAETREGKLFLNSKEVIFN
ncbi:MAG: YdgA family protein [Desulfobacula sp.]|nr:YdgA family protein [Desulfobacula sp.]